MGAEITVRCYVSCTQRDVVRERRTRDVSDGVSDGQLTGTTQRPHTLLQRARSESLTSLTRRHSPAVCCQNGHGEGTLII